MNKLFPIILVLLFFGCDEDNPVASDTTAPIVTITFPSDGSTLSAQTTISVNVVDDSDIDSVWFIVNGVSEFIDTVAPYEYSWDVCALTDETATILINAFDSFGNTGVSDLLTYSVDGSYDCAEVCGGESLEDECGVCDEDSSNDCAEDECGVYPQDQLNCCEGVNDEGEVDPNWTTCP